MPKVLSNLNLGKNQLQNAVVHPLAAAPSAPVEGQFYYDTGDKLAYVYTGTAWTSLGGGGGAGLARYSAITDGTATNSATGNSVLEFRVSGDGLSRTIGGTGSTQFVQYAFDASAISITASQVNDLGGYVTAQSLSVFSPPSGDVSWSNFKIADLADPTQAQDAATKAYVDSVAQGLDVKQSVKVAPSSQLGLPSGTGTYDGVALNVGDRVLLWTQSNPVRNGIYVVQSGTWTRATDADTNAKLGPGAFVFVEQGASADKGFVLTSDSVDVGVTQNLWTQFTAVGSAAGANLGAGSFVYSGLSGSNLQFRSFVAGSTKLTITQNTNDLTFDVAESALTISNMGGTLAVSHGGTGAVDAAGAKANLAFMTRYAVDVGDGSATSVVVTHNLNTRDVTVQVREAASPYAAVLCDVEMTSVNTVTLTFAVAPTAGQYRAVVQG